MLRRLWWCALLSAIAPACAGQVSHDEEPDSFKEVVDRVVRATRENLRPVKTFRVTMQPSAEYWYEVGPVDVLPGAKQCRVYEHPRLIYRCEWKREKNVPVTALYANVAKELGQALGADWTVRAAPKETVFEPVDPRRNGLVEVRVAGNPRDPVVEVIFSPVPEQDRF